MKSKLLIQVKNPTALVKARWIMVFVAVLSSMLTYSQVSINNDGSAPHASAMLEVKSTTRGFLLPRMNLATRPAAPTTGLMIYQLDFGPGIYFYNGAGWDKMSLAAYDFWNPNGSDIYFNAGRVAIGTNVADNNGLNVQNYIIGKGAVRGADQSGSYIYAEGYLGVLVPAPLGVPIAVTNVGVLGIKPNLGSNGAAVYGWNNDGNSMNYGGLFYTDGNYSQGTNYGIYSVAEKSNQNFAGYFRGRVSIDGNTGPSLAADSTQTVLSSRVKHIQYVDTRAVEGISTPKPGYGFGVYGQGGWRGVYGYGDGADYTGTTVGVYGDAYGTAGTRYGIYGIGGGTGTGTRVGVYGYAYGGATNWGSYFVGSNYMSGDLRIGTTTAATGYALSVNGKIACTEVLVQAMASWPDYVFKPEYNLMSLDNLEQNIRENGHLPGLPSAREIETNGLHLGNMQKQVVEKVEELTLYTIEQGKLLKEQGKMLQEFKKEIDVLKAENASLKRSIGNK